MKSADIITQLQIMLPKFTDKFSTNIGITSIVPALSGNEVLLTTDTTHNLLVGNIVNIVGSLSPINITNIKVELPDLTIGTVTTSQDHDLTDGFFEKVTIIGNSQVSLNGTFPFLNQINRRTFTYQLPQPELDGTFAGGQLTNPGGVGGFNGLVTILTVPSATTFTYETKLQQINTSVLDTGEVRQALRITGAIDVERAEAMYSPVPSDDQLWAFVILDGSNASKDRSGQNDAISSAGPSGSRRQQVMQTCTIAVFSQAENDLSARLARDIMEDLNPAMFGSLIGAKISSGLTEGTNLGLNFISSGVIKYTGSYLIFGWAFELLATINDEDTVEPGFDVAFRDISLSMGTNLGTHILTATLDLDDEPL